MLATSLVGLGRSPAIDFVRVGAAMPCGLRTESVGYEFADSVQCSCTLCIALFISMFHFSSKINDFEAFFFN